MNIVLDTNVLVSGLLTPYGAGGEIVRLVSAGALVLLYDSRILLEYGDVLYRPKFKFNTENVKTFLSFIKMNGQVVSAGPLKNRLPDPDDEPFLEAALAGRAACLITGNLKHFPETLRQGVTVYSPSEFIGFYRKLKC